MGHYKKIVSARLPILGLLLLVTSACQAPPQEPDKTPAPGGVERTLGSPHDLSQDEKSGGHTLKKHVGRGDEQLRQRLERERGISAASTYTDRETAERVVGAALQHEQPKIRRWLERGGGHPNLVLGYDGDLAHPIGRTLRRGEDQATPCSHAIVVLKWSGLGDYYVLTSYPECR
jgi:hypothetical protein